MELEKDNSVRKRQVPGIWHLASLPIKLYKLLLSPFLPASCRFLPTCSDYCTEAIEKYGFKGVIMCLKRILRCRPGGGSGVDEVP